MKLDDFLKCKKVRCVDGDATIITTGKVYDVIGVDETFIHVTDDNGEEACYWYCRFEPVLDSVVNPLQGVELTPEFEAVEPKFKVGDKVYCLLLEPKIFTILGVDSDNTAHFGESGKFGYEWWSFKNLCHATQENYERLQATFPDIEFEQPPKELKGSDLCRAMLEKGWKFIPCYVSDDSDQNAIDHEYVDLIACKDHLFRNSINGYEHEYAVPFDPRTGEPLTEAVLDE